MASSKSRPGWVISDLMDVIGLDKETVETMIAPDLDNYTQETRLRSHLQDFLGPSPKAKAFTERYLAFRFPSIASSSSALAPPSQVGPHPNKPNNFRTGPNTKNTQPPSRTRTPTTHTSKPLSLDDLETHFGAGGKIYQKNREVDADLIWSNPVKTGPYASGSGSGTNTPGRPAGAVTFSEAKPRRIDHPQANPVGGKGKQVEKIWDVPKSREVKRLEGVIGDLRGLQNSEGKVNIDPGKQDCFCQARNHPLSRYTPHCPHCGLVICKLHKPHHPCPSCEKVLHTPAQLARLIQKIQSEVEDQLAIEKSQQDQEERARLERLALESGGGSFPTLSGGAPHQTSSSHVDTGRKVLTIGGKGKGKGKSTTTLTTTYSRPTPTSSRPTTPPPTDIVLRPRSPPMDQERGEKELQKNMTWRETEDRPWGDLKLAKRGGWEYKARAVLELVEEDKIGRRRRKKGEAVERGWREDGTKVVGAA